MLNTRNRLQPQKTLRSGQDGPLRFTALLSGESVCVSVNVVEQRFLLVQRLAWQLHADELTALGAADVEQKAATAKQAAKVVNDREVEGNETGHGSAFRVVGCGCHAMTYCERRAKT